MLPLGGSSTERHRPAPAMPEPPREATWRPTILHTPVRLRLAGDRLVREHGARREESVLADVAELAIWPVDLQGPFAALTSGRLQAHVMVGPRRIRLSGERLESHPRRRVDDDPRLAALMLALARQRAALGPGCRFVIGNRGDAAGARALAITSAALGLLILAGSVWVWLGQGDSPLPLLAAEVIPGLQLLLAWRHHRRRRPTEVDAEAFLRNPLLEPARST